MKVAFSIWRERIAPVFDTANDFLLAEVTGGEFADQRLCKVSEGQSGDVAQWLSNQEVKALVCGAISRCLQVQLEMRGIEVFPFVAGELDVIKAAWLEKKLRSASFAMPGCGRGRGGRGRCGGGRRFNGVGRCGRE